VSETPKAPPAKTAAKAPADLGSAAASGDPAVQNLLGARGVAELNEDAAEVARIDGLLAGLGVTVA